MNRVLASGPIVWLGIIVTTGLLLVLFQTVLWLVVPVLLAVVAYYVLSPLVIVAMAQGMTRVRAVLLVTLLLSLVLGTLGLIVGPNISSAVHNLPALVEEYAAVCDKLIKNAQQTLYRY